MFGLLGSGLGLARNNSSSEVPKPLVVVVVVFKVGW